MFRLESRRKHGMLGIRLGGQPQLQRNSLGRPNLWWQRSGGPQGSLVAAHTLPRFIRWGVGRHGELDSASAVYNGPNPAGKMEIPANIAAVIKDAQQQRSARTDVTADAVVRELAYIAFGDISGLFDAQGRLREAHDLAPGVRARIAAIDVVRERTRAVGDTTVEESTVKVRVWDKVRALELLMKHLGLLTEQVNVTLVADRDRLLEAGRQRNADATKHDREG